MPPPSYKASKTPSVSPDVSTTSRKSSAISVPVVPKKPPVTKTSPSASASSPTTPAAIPTVPTADDIFFEIYKSSMAGLGWRWVMYQQLTPAARGIITGCYGRTLESKEAAEKHLAEFKRLVATSPTRIKGE